MSSLQTIGRLTAALALVGLLAAARAGAEEDDDDFHLGVIEYEVSWHRRAGRRARCRASR